MFRSITIAFGEKTTYRNIHHCLFFIMMFDILLIKKSIMYFVCGLFFQHQRYFKHDLSFYIFNIFNITNSQTLQENVNEKYFELEGISGYSKFICIVATSMYLMRKFIIKCTAWKERFSNPQNVEKYLCDYLQGCSLALLNKAQFKNVDGDSHSS